MITNGKDTIRYKSLTWTEKLMWSA